MLREKKPLEAKMSLPGQRHMSCVGVSCAWMVRSVGVSSPLASGIDSTRLSIRHA